MTIFKTASKPIAAYHDWDSRFTEVVRSILSDLGALPAGRSIEHVGSTAIPGCGGKGVIDLLVLCTDSTVEETKSWLLSLGLNRQGPEFSRPWRDSRPMYLGWYRWMDLQFLIYVHIVRQGSDEVRRFLEFRELLTANPELVAEYCTLKRQILSDGVTDTDEYALRKRSFYRKALGSNHALRDDHV